MKYRRDDGIEVDGVDVLLFVAIGILSLLILVEMWWGSWVRILDMRNWSGWTWCGIVAALTGVLAAMHFWREIRSWLPWRREAGSREQRRKQGI